LILTTGLNDILVSCTQTETMTCLGHCSFDALML
jgi:hypothetical protein